MGTLYKIKKVTELCQWIVNYILLKADTIFINDKTRDESVKSTLLEITKHVAIFYDNAYDEGYKAAQNSIRK
jgi:hypothetical protein